MSEEKNTARLVVRARNIPPVTCLLGCPFFAEVKGAFVMQKIENRLTVFFDDPFWTGVYERVSDGELTVSKVIFGAEPKDYEVYEFFIENWHKLSFSPPVEAEPIRESRINPKRMQRETKKQLEGKGIGTKSQQALKLQQETGKEARKIKSREQREYEDKLKFGKKQLKKMEKHRGH